MGYHLYSGQDVWILVPDCLRVARAAASEFGPLEFIGPASVGNLTFEELAYIGRQFDARSYALVDGELATRLRTARAPGAVTGAARKRRSTA